MLLKLYRSQADAGGANFKLVGIGARGPDEASVLIVKIVEVLFFLFECVERFEFVLEIMVFKIVLLIERLSVVERIGFRFVGRGRFSFGLDEPVEVGFQFAEQVIDPRIEIVFSVVDGFAEFHDFVDAEVIGRFNDEFVRERTEVADRAGWLES